MDMMDIERNIIVKNSKLPNYLADLLEIEDEVILVYGQKKTNLYETFGFNTSDVSKSNITGTPLEIDLNIDTSVQQSRGGRDDKYLIPINLSQARMFINNHVNSKEKCKFNTFVCICDGADKQHTLVLMSSLSDLWFDRTLVYAQGTVSLNCVKDNLECMKEYHLNNCEDGIEKVDSQITCIYELYGFPLNDFDLEDDVYNVGSISLQCSWNSFQFNIPEQSANINMMLQVIVGHENSSVFSLYQDLELLQKCITEVSNKNTTATATLSLNPKEDHELYGSITDILHTVYSIEPSCSVSASNGFQQAVSHNFTDKLWNILKYCENTNTLQQCFKILFTTMENEKLKIQILEHDKVTMIGQAIYEIFSGRMLIPDLSSKQCLELLIDLCMQKLMKYYWNVIKLFDLKIAKEYYAKWNHLSLPTEEHKRSAIVDLCISREFEKAQFLFHTHIVVEFLHLIEKYGFNKDINKLVLKPAFDKYLTVPMRNTFFNIKTKRLCDLTMSLSFHYVHSIFSYYKPCMWKMKLVTRLKHYSNSTCFYYSKKPLFPANVYNYQDDLNETMKEEKLYAVRVESYGIQGRYFLSST